MSASGFRPKFATLSSDHFKAGIFAYISFMKPEDVRLGRVYFEMREVGKYVRVSAIDPITNTEVHIAGDRSASKERLKRVAMNKLRYVIAKNSPDDDDSIIA